MNQKQLLTFLFCTIPFLLLMHFMPTATIFWLKIIPIGFLAYCVSKSNNKNRLLILLALLCSAIGDVFLALDRSAWFVQGLASFFVAHLFYISVYFKRGINMRRDKRILSLVLVAVASIFSFVLLPATAELLPMVTVYMVVIMTMALFAINLTRQNGWITFGAISFVLSDSLIAIDTFLLPLPLASLAIMISYYAAQATIVYGLLQVSHKKIDS